MEFTITFTIPDFLIRFFKKLYKIRIILLAIILPSVLLINIHSQDETPSADLKDLKVFNSGAIVYAADLNNNFDILNQIILDLRKDKISELYAKVGDETNPAEGTFNANYKKIMDDLTERILVLGKGAVPSNIVVMWDESKEYIREDKGWKLCDGTNDTPDLRGRSIVGASGDDAGSLPDGKYYFLNKENINPEHLHNYAHSHSQPVNFAGVHQHTWLNKNGVNWQSYVSSIPNDMMTEDDFTLSAAGSNSFVPLLFDGTGAVNYFQTFIGLDGYNDGDHNHTLELNDSSQDLDSGKAKLKPPRYGIYYIIKE